MKSMRCLVDLFSTFVVGVSFWFVVSNSKAQQIEAGPANTTVNDLGQLASIVSSASKGSEQEFEQNGNGEKVLRLPSFSNPVKAGVIRPGSKVNFRLKVENPLAVPLHILGGEASCACTEIRAEQGVIEPKGTGFVLMKIDAGPKETNRAVVGSLIATSQIEGGSTVTAKEREDIFHIPFRLLFATRAECSFSCDQGTYEISPRSEDGITIQISNYSSVEWQNPVLIIEPPYLQPSLELVREEDKDDVFRANQVVRVRLTNSKEFSLSKLANGATTPITLRLFSSVPGSDAILRQVGESTLNITHREEIELSPKYIDLNSSNSATFGVHVISRDRNVVLSKEQVEFVIADTDKRIAIADSKAISDRWMYFELDRKSINHPEKNFEIIVRCFLDSTKKDWRETRLLGLGTN